MAWIPAEKTANFTRLFLTDRFSKSRFGAGRARPSNVTDFSTVICLRKERRWGYEQEGQRNLVGSEDSRGYGNDRDCGGVARGAASLELYTRGGDGVVFGSDAAQSLDEVCAAACGAFRGRRSYRFSQIDARGLCELCRERRDRYVDRKATVNRKDCRGHAFRRRTVLLGNEFRRMGGLQHVSKVAGGTHCLLRRGDSILLEHAGRRRALRHSFIRRVRFGRELSCGDPPDDRTEVMRGRIFNRHEGTEAYRRHWESAYPTADGRQKPAALLML